MMTADPTAADLGDELDAVTARCLAELARRGLGSVLGITAPGRAGIKRISRAPGPEFQDRIEASFRGRYRALVRHATEKLGDHARAEDSVQRAFEKVWRTCMRSTREIHNMDAYVFTAVASEINNDLRRIVERRGDSPLEDMPHLVATGPEPQVRVAETLLVKAALATLPPREREAIILRGQYELTVAETAEIMKLSEGAVKRYTADATRKIRAAFAA